MLRRIPQARRHWANSLAPRTRNLASPLAGQADATRQRVQAAARVVAAIVRIEAFSAAVPARDGAVAVAVREVLGRGLDAWVGVTQCRTRPHGRRPRR